MGYGKITISRESEIKDGLEDFIFDFLEDASPLLSKEDRRKIAKQRSTDAFSHIEDQLSAMEQEKQKNADEYERIEISYVKRIQELKSDAADLEKEVESKNDEICRLEEKVADLELQVKQPEEWLGRKYGI
jgi:uncharacterized protein YaaN involved in tellurite resistance